MVFGGFNGLRHLNILASYWKTVRHPTVWNQNFEQSFIPKGPNTSVEVVLDRFLGLNPSRGTGPFGSANKLSWASPMPSKRCVLAANTCAFVFPRAPKIYENLVFTTQKPGLGRRKPLLLPVFMPLVKSVFPSPNITFPQASFRKNLGWSCPRIGPKANWLTYQHKD